MCEIEKLKQTYYHQLLHKINWRSWEEKPEEGVEIWVLKWHSKGHFPSSFEICAGEVEYGEKGVWRVNTCDHDGGGCNCFYPNDYNNGFLYWFSKWEISIPEYLINWNWCPGV